MTGREESPEQLPLSMPAAPSAGLPHRLRPMQPTAWDAPFDDDAWFFEPWWPGARTLAFVEAGRLRLQGEHLGDPLASVPELTVIGEQAVGDALVLDGTLLVLDAQGRPDPNLLRARLSGEGLSNDAGGHGAFVASDLLYAEGRPLTARPFSERRERLGRALRDGEWCMVSRGLRGDGTTLAAAVASMGVGVISARRLDGRYRVGEVAEEWLRMPVRETTAPETRPLLTLLQRLPM